MRSFKRVFMLLAVAAAAGVAPVQAQPLTVAAGAAQSAFVTTGRYTVVANQVTGTESSGLFIYNQLGADNNNGSPNFVADFTASGTHSSCVFVPTFSCTNWSAPQQNVSATAYQADPLGNTVTINATILDTSSQPHAFRLTLTRPTYTNLGYNAPNVWVDASTGSAQATVPVLVIARAGYTVNGTIDNVPVLNAQNCSPSGTCGYGAANTWTQAGPAPVTING